MQQIQGDDILGSWQVNARFEEPYFHQILSNQSFWLEDLLALSSVLTYSPQPQDVVVVISYDLKATDHGISNFMVGDCLHIANLHHMMAKTR